MSAASRTIQAAPGTRQVGIALFALVVLLALGAVLVYGSLSAAKLKAPAAGAAPAVHDHGWSADPAAGSGTSQGAAVDAARHRPKSPVSSAQGTGSAGIVIKGAEGGGIVYTGIPYPAPGAGSAGDATGGSGSTRVRLAR
jgi:hypothetical protein